MASYGGYGGHTASQQHRGNNQRGPNSPIYQIDFSAIASGKRIASTKRRVRWRFGFANADALAQGKTGMECRGEEHDITLVWSITSGKRLILADGHEVHYSNSRSANFDFSWTMKGGHVLKMVAFASPPLSEKPGFRQYDLFVDGQSFFNFPKMFRIGLKGPAPPMHGGGYGYPNAVEGGYKTGNTGGDYTPRTQSQEEADMQRAIQASLMESGPRYTANANVSDQHKNEVEDLLDFGSDPLPEPIVAPAPAIMPAQNSQRHPNFNDFYPSNFAPAPAHQVAQPHPAFATAPAPPVYGQQQQMDHIANRDRFGSISSNISAPPPGSSNNPWHSNDASTVFSAPTQNGFQPAPAPNSNPVSIDSMYQKMANTDFFAPSTSGAPGNPFDISATGPQPTLGSMQASRPNESKQPVMNSPSPMMQNAVVLHPQQQTGNYGYNNYTSTNQATQQQNHFGNGQEQSYNGYGANTGQPQGYGMPPPPQQQYQHGAFGQQQQQQPYYNQQQYYGRQ